MQLYAAFGRFVLFFVLFWIGKLKKFKEGFIFWSFVFLIGLGRFSLDFLREGDKFYGLLAGQWFGLVMVFVGGYVLVRSYGYDVRSVTGRVKKSL